MHQSALRLLLPSMLLAGMAPAASAQDTTTTSRDTVTKPAAPAVAPLSRLDFSGVLFLSYQTGGTAAERRAQQNRFDVDRVYLTFRAPAGDRLSIRVTTDLYQQRDASRDEYYRGWTLRAKYAYAQYDLRPASRSGFGAVARLGMLHTPVVDYEEQFWIRGLAPTAADANGFFSSSDLGVASQVTLPNRVGEVYAAVLNGSGYGSRETDRFKDYGARLTLTPLASRSGWLRTLGVSPWFYKGTRASDFALGRGSVRPVSQGRQKDRYGVHVGIRDPRLTIGSQFGWRVEDIESVADTITTTEPTVTSRTGTLLSAYTVLKPLALAAGGATSPLNLVFRYDRVKPDRTAPSYAQFVIAGIGLDLSRRASVWVDYQTQDPKNGSSAADVKTLFVHGIVSF